MQKGLAKSQPQFEPILSKRFQAILDRMNQTLARLRGR